MTPTNAELIAKSHEVELEGEESESVATQVSEFVTAERTKSAQDKATLQSALDTALTRALSDEEREEAMTALNNTVNRSNNFQAVLTALVTPAAEPLPESPSNS